MTHKQQVQRHWKDAFCTRCGPTPYTVYAAKPSKKWKNWPIGYGKSASEAWKDAAEHMKRKGLI